MNFEMNQDNQISSLQLTELIKFQSSHRNEDIFSMMIREKILSDYSKEITDEIEYQANDYVTEQVGI